MFVVSQKYYTWEAWSNKQEFQPVGLWTGKCIICKWKGRKFSVMYLTWPHANLFVCCSGQTRNSTMKLWRSWQASSRRILKCMLITRWATTVSSPGKSWQLGHSYQIPFKKWVYSEQKVKCTFVENGFYLVGAIIVVAQVRWKCSYMGEFDLHWPHCSFAHINKTRLILHPLVIFEDSYLATILPEWSLLVEKMLLRTRYQFDLVSNSYPSFWLTYCCFWLPYYQIKQFSIFLCCGFLNQHCAVC